MKRDFWERSKVWGAIGLAFGTLGFCLWFATWAMPITYPQQRGYPIEGVAPVDLASAQRNWPGGEARPGDREILLGYIRELEAGRVTLPQGAQQAGGPAAPVDLGTLLAGADAGRGERTAQVCASCHTFDAGGANRTGPNLHGVVGRAVAGLGGFSYSPALTGHGGQWTYEALDQFLTSPARAIPGTRMAFAGLRNPRDRAHLIAYLASISPGAPPFPAPAPAAQPATQAPAGGASR